MGNNNDRQRRNSNINRRHHNKLRKEGKMSVNGKRKAEPGWCVVDTEGNAVHYGNSTECLAWARSANSAADGTAHYKAERR